MELRNKIKTIMFNIGGFPGFDQDEYMDQMRAILSIELTADEKSQLNRDNVRIDSLIIELSKEIVDEYL